MRLWRILLYLFSFLLYINQVQAECVGNLTRRDEPRTNTLGCFIKDNLSNDTLDGLTKINFSDPYTDRDRILMDPGLCIMFCANYLFNYSALTRGSECRCGNQDGLKAYIQTSNSSCNIPCVGNNSYFCGGQEAYTIYTAALTKNKIPPGGLPPINKKLDILNSPKNDISYKGCFKDSPYCNVRRLDGIQFEEQSMTVDMCTKYCSQKNYKYAGLEEATQCFCGNSYDSFTALGSEDCGSSCGGNSSQICGGPLTLSIYEVFTNPAPSNPSPNLSTEAITIIGIKYFLDLPIDNNTEEVVQDLIEKLIPGNNITVNEYITVDLTLKTSEMLDDDDIIALVCGDENVEDNNKFQVESKITTKDTIDSVDKLISFLTNIEEQFNVKSLLKGQLKSKEVTEFPHVEITTGEIDSDDLNEEDERNKEKSNWVVYLAQTEKFSDNAKANKTSDQIEEFSDDVKAREILDQTKRFSNNTKAREASNQVVHMVSIEDGKDGNDQTSW
ncbi:8112_t:CDS:2, partial [Acaulospora morrowiae]